VESVGGDSVALFISANAIWVHDIRFVLSTPGSKKLAGAIRIANSEDVVIEHCEVLPSANLSEGQRFVNVCVLVDSSRDICLTNNRFIGCVTGVLVGNASGRFDALGNTIMGLTLTEGMVSIGRFGIELRAVDMLVICTVKHNRMENFFTGIYLGQMAVNAVVESNRLSASLVAGFVPSIKTDFAGMSTAASALNSLSAVPFQIQILGNDSKVRLNRIDLRGAFGGGILLHGRRALVAENTIRGSLKYPEIKGILLGVHCASDGTASGADGTTVSGNNLQQLMSGISADRVYGLALKGNRIEDTVAAIVSTKSSALEIIGNLISRSMLGLTISEGDNCRSIDNEIDQVVTWGIASLRGAEPELRGNRLQACAIGIACVQWTGALVISHNRLKLCGTPISSGAMQFYQGIAIGAIRSNSGNKENSASSLTVESCEIIDRPPVGAASNTWTAIVARAQDCRILNNSVIQSDALSMDKDVAKALLLMNPEESGGSALVNGNTFSGAGPASLVDIGFSGLAWTADMKPGYGRVTFSNNQCNHLVNDSGWGRRPSEYAIRLWGQDVIAIGNHVSSTGRYLSMELRHKGRATMLGNVTSNGYLVNTVNLKPQAYADFNF
jgi:nitrous oxidase accessory protein NosD